MKYTVVETLKYENVEAESVGEAERLVEDGFAKMTSYDMDTEEVT